MEYINLKVGDIRKIGDEFTHDTGGERIECPNTKKRVPCWSPWQRTTLAGRVLLGADLVTTIYRRKV